MKSVQNYIVFLLLISVVFLNSCLSSTSSSYVASDDPTIATFYFASNDSFPAIGSAVFTVEDRIDTGLIYNVDSLEFGTPIDSLVPRITFKGSAVGAAIIYTPTDTISLSGTDTIDFSVRPIYVQVISETLTEEKWYEIRVNVHQVDPDLYFWTKIADNIIPNDYINQKTVMVNNKFYLLAGDGLHTKMFSSADAITWSEQDAPFTNFDVHNTIVDANRIICLNDNQLVVWTEATSWQSVDFTSDYELVQLMFSFNNDVWAIGRMEDKYAILIANEQLTNWEVERMIGDDFPISDFASVTFFSPTKRPRAMIIGGYSSKGECLNTRWNVEYSKTDGYRWENFSIDQPSFEALAGVSVLYYDKHFFMFGGVNAYNQTGDSHILESYNEGMTWSQPDTVHNTLPKEYQARAYQSVVVDEDNNIYIVGGKSRTEVFTDVYKGRLNSIDWE